MERDDVFENGNGYINIPVWLFRSMYDGDDAGFEKFLFDVIAWGFATCQIAELDENCRVHEVENGLSLEELKSWIPYAIHLSQSYQTTLRDTVDFFRDWISENGANDWMIHSKDAKVGITFCAINTMVNANYKNNREKSRVQHCWIIYLALKSIIGKGKNTGGKRTWDNILNRALGSTSLITNICPTDEQDWTKQYRCGKGVQSRKKMDVIARLQESWGVQYAAKDPTTGKPYRIPWFGIKRIGYRKKR